MSKKKNIQNTLQEDPYSNMQARKTVLMIGLGFSVAAVIFLVLGAFDMFLFPNMFKSQKPLDVVLILLAVAAGLAVVGLVLGVAGANTSKPIAKLSFFFSVNSFIISAGMLIVLLLFFKGIIPLPGLEGMFGVKDPAMFM